MKVISANLTVYGMAHCLVDMVCAGILFSTAAAGQIVTSVLAYLFISYNVLAFGLQVFAGFIIDHFKAPRAAAVTGLIIIGAAAVIYKFSLIASIILAGTGNAIFHVGGGVISLNLTPRKATAPGIYVAPGAIGLMAGMLLGKNGNFLAWPFLIVLIVIITSILLIKKPDMYAEETQPVQKQAFKNEYVIYLVLFVIAVRSLAGFAVIFPWKTEIPLLVLLTLSVALGKGLGGYLADKFGWTKVAVGSLILSIPLLNIGGNIPAAGILGMFLFNITMPVTLAMTSNLLPGQPGTAFALTCMALLFGALPSFSALKTIDTVFTDIFIAISAVTLFLALRYYNKAQFTSNRKSVYDITSGSQGPDERLTER